MFNSWPERIGHFEVCLIQPPGRENRFGDEHFGSYESFASELGLSLAPYLDRPYAFFGHCAAALPAFETARELAQLGVREPEVVFVSAQVAPVDCPHDRFLELTQEELMDELVVLTRRRGAEPNPTLLTLSMEVLNADLDANRRYRRAEVTPVDFGIHIIHWDRDDEVEQAELQSWQPYSDDVRSAVLPGAHYDFLDAPEELINLISTSISAGGWA